MRRIVVGTVVAGLLLGPAACAVGMPLMLAFAEADGVCGKLAVGNVPPSLEARTTSGVVVHLDQTQLAHAATIIAVGNTTEGVGRDGIVIALMAALTESRLRMLANTRAYPQTRTFPHDGDGADHDSLGLFQMRPAAGWGSPSDLMDPTYQARAFYGGPSGPNAGSPRGLLDIPNWQELPRGAAAQAVEVSAFPDRYAVFEPVAEAILTALTTSAPDGVAPVSPVVFPLPAGTWTRTSGFGMRLNPVLGVRRLHAGADFAAPSGTPVYAVADGRVVTVSPAGGLGNHIAIEHTIDGEPVVTVYGHLRDESVRVAVGDVVLAGQHIGDVGSTGNSTGPHLHLEVRPGAATAPAIDPEPWLTTAGATELATATTPGCAA